jgi:hypothetical protein
MHDKYVFFLNNQPDIFIIPILFCYKILHVSGIFSAHHQAFSTVHSALVSCMLVFYYRFLAESGWNSIPVCGLPANRTHNPEFHTIPTT